MYQIGDAVKDRYGRDFTIKKIRNLEGEEAESMAKRGWRPFVLTLQGRERERTAYVDGTNSIWCMVNVDKAYPGRFE